MRQSPPIIYTWTDEAPALATHAFLPVVRAFAAAGHLHRMAQEEEAALARLTEELQGGEEAAPADAISAEEAAGELPVARIFGTSRALEKVYDRGATAEDPQRVRPPGCTPSSLQEGGEQRPPTPITGRWVIWYIT